MPTNLLGESPRHVPINRSFLPFKNKHEGEAAIVFGTGGSLREFSYAVLPEEPLVRVGVNLMIYKREFELDYYWCSDFPDNDYVQRESGYLETIIERSRDTQVFCGTTVNGRQQPRHFTSEHAKAMNAIEYDLHLGHGPNAFSYDLVTMPFYNHSIIFSAMQFLLYAGVQRIYVVGCDCGGVNSCVEVKFEDGRLHSQERYALHRNLIEDWQHFAEFKDKEYPNVEIVSVNPLNLKGLFSDIGG